MAEHLTTSAHTYGGTLAMAGGRELRVSSGTEVTHVALYASPPYEVEVPALAVARLSINLSPGRVDGQIGSEPSRTFLVRRHSLFLTPAGAAASWRKSTSSRHVNIYFDARSFDPGESSAGRGTTLDGLPLLNARVPGTGPLIDAIAAELTNEHPFRAEAIDSLARLLLVTVGRHVLQRRERASPITSAIQCRLVDFVQARLGQRVLVADLAQAAGLAPSHFAEAFARATGESPHQFVLRLRVEHALQLLRNSGLPIAHVAAECGFSNQQHMTRVMRDRLGTTPAQQRACPTREAREFIESRVGLFAGSTHEGTYLPST